MARPRKCRKICCLPENVHFAPVGVRCDSASSATVVLLIDEYEAIRLIDLEGMTQEECAGKMNIARTTVQAIYTAARKKLADTIVNGKRLLIEGGVYQVCEGGARCGRGCRRFSTGNTA